MTVKDLIKRLQDFTPEHEVWVFEEGHIRELESVIASCHKIYDSEYQSFKDDLSRPIVVIV